MHLGAEERLKERKKSRQPTLGRPRPAGESAGDPQPDTFRRRRYSTGVPYPEAEGAQAICQRPLPPLAERQRFPTAACADPRGGPDCSLRGPSFDPPEALDRLRFRPDSPGLETKRFEPSNCSVTKFYSRSDRVSLNSSLQNPVQTSARKKLKKDLADGLGIPTLFLPFN